MWKDLKRIISHPWNKVIIEIENVLVVAICMHLNLGNGYKGVVPGSLNDRTIFHLGCWGGYIELHMCQNCIPAHIFKWMHI